MCAKDQREWKCGLLTSGLTLPLGIHCECEAGEWKTGKHWGGGGEKKTKTEQYSLFLLAVLSSVCCECFDLTQNVLYWNSKHTEAPLWDIPRGQWPSKAHFILLLSWYAPKLALSKLYFMTWCIKTKWRENNNFSGSYRPVCTYRNYSFYIFYTQFRFCGTLNFFVFTSENS